MKSKAEGEKDELRDEIAAGEKRVQQIQQSIKGLESELKDYKVRCKLSGSVLTRGEANLFPFWIKSMSISLLLKETQMKPFTGCGRCIFYYL